MEKEDDVMERQTCQLFGRDQSVAARHIANIFKEGELPQEGFMQILHKTATAGRRPIEMRSRKDLLDKQIMEIANV